MPESNTRDRLHPIKVYVSDPERQKINRMATKMQMSVSTFLRTLGVGNTPKSAFDQEAIKKLIKVHADQGRLGGLLKLCLSEWKGEPDIRAQCRSLLKDVELVQTHLADWIMTEKKRK